MSHTNTTKKSKSARGVSSVQVARLAGVSQAAVSRVFTKGASASPKMRAKVVAAAKKLGYRPNVIARSLTQRSTNMIGIVMSLFTNPFYARLLKEFSHKLQELDYRTLLLNIEVDTDLETALPTALQYQVDGLIITSATLSSTMADECARVGTPVVLFNRTAMDSQVNAVCSDNVAGGRMVADALLNAGHQRIAYLSGEEQSSTNRDRHKGFIERLREREQDLFAHECGDYSYESGFAAAERVLQRDPRPDAIFCANDLMALGVLDYARYQAQVAIPDQLSVIGFDDIPMASWPKYSLTTVRQPVKRLVDTTIQVLMSAIQNPNDGRVMRLIPVDLVERTSAKIA